jgi:hypothetical protein
MSLPRHLRRLAAPALLAALAGAAPAAADIVVLRGGGTVKVTGYEVGTERARLELHGGGVMTLPILRIERIVEDEIVVAGPEAELPRGSVALAFHDAHAVPEGPYGELVFAAARRHGVNPAVIAAVMRAESAFRPAAVSHKGARGLMQLMPATAERFGLRLADIHDPERNIDAGTRYLRWLLDRFGEDPARVLAAYNAGEGAVERYGGVPPYRETRAYVKKILSALGVADEAPGGAQLAVAAGG